MAEEDLALKGAEVDEPRQNDALADQQQDNQEEREPTASEIAAEMGWKPKDQWTGDPDDWKPAAQFIRDGRDIQQNLSRELRGMREQVERIGGVTTQIIQDKVAERDAFWSAKLEQAVEDGDTEAAKRAASELNKPKAQPVGNDPSITAWIAKNDWYTKDPAAQLRAQEVSDRLAQQGRSVTEQLEAAARIVRKEFPELFPAPAKQPPATQTGQNRTAAPSNRQKGFADMPPESRQAALDFERLNGLPKEKFAENYWRIEARKGSRA